MHFHWKLELVLEVQEAQRCLRSMMFMDLDFTPILP